MKTKLLPLVCALCTCLPAMAGKKTPPSAEEIRALETISLSYRVSSSGLEFSWSPANAEPSGGIKLTCSETNPQPLYPQDGYIAWLPGTGKTSCVVPFDKAMSNQTRHYRVCSVHKDDHGRYVALSRVVSVPPLSGGAPVAQAEPVPSKPEPKASPKVEPKADAPPAPKVKESPAAPPSQSAATPGVLRRPSGGLVVGHGSTDPSKVPVPNIEKARRMFHVWYGHTSHGSQITSGMQAMNRAPFLYNRDGSGGALRYEETGGDLGHSGDLGWERSTRRYLDGGGKANVIMWSWCGGCSDNNPEGVRAYLERMDRLERDYPGRIFIYMTGHLDGTGASGNLHKVNEQIREYCRSHGKVLFDFADIESHDPSGNSFLDLRADDGCNYVRDGRRGNWAKEWIAANPDHGIALPGSAAHTHPLNGALKGRAFWVLLGQLAAGQGE